MTGADAPVQQSVDRIADAVRASGLRVACAESLTSGRVMSRLGAGSEASSWFAGGVVAYDEEVKFHLLEVTRGPVITERCARELARGVAGLLEADVALGITGCGGPDPEEGKAPGTTYFCVWTAEGEHAEEARFSGDPDEVLEQATARSLAVLADVVERVGAAAAR